MTVQKCYINQNQHRFMLHLCAEEKKRHKGSRQDSSRQLTHSSFFSRQMPSCFPFFHFFLFSGPLQAYSLTESNQLHDRVNSHVNPHICLVFLLQLSTMKMQIRQPHKTI